MTTKHRNRFAKLAAVLGMLGVCAIAAMPARAAERSLLGVRIFTPVNSILHRFGDPTYISTGMNIAGITYLPGMVALAPPAGSTFGGGNAPGGYGGGYPAAGGGMGAGRPMGPMGGPAAMGPMGPGMMGRGPMGAGGPGGFAAGEPGGFMPGGRPGFGGPGVGGPGAMGGATGYGQAGDPADTFTATDITHYYYVRPHGVYYEFVLSPDGRVLSVRVYGTHSDARTARGIALGSTYAQVVEKYGYPEQTVNTAGGALTVSYMRRDHVAFRLSDNKVAGIIVSAAD